MTRIGRIGVDNTRPIEGIKSKSQSKVYETFKQKLNKVEQEHIREELKVLFNRIETQTNKLQDKLFIEDLIEYKELVKDF